MSEDRDLVTEADVIPADKIIVAIEQQLKKPECASFYASAPENARTVIGLLFYSQIWGSEISRRQWRIYMNEVFDDLSLADVDYLLKYGNDANGLSPQVRSDLLDLRAKLPGAYSVSLEYQAHANNGNMASSQVGIDQNKPKIKMRRIRVESKPNFGPTYADIRNMNIAESKRKARKKAVWIVVFLVVLCVIGIFGWLQYSIWREKNVRIAYMNAKKAKAIEREEQERKREAEEAEKMRLEEERKQQIAEEQKIKEDFEKAKAEAEAKMLSEEASRKAAEIEEFRRREAEVAERERKRSEKKHQLLEDDDWRMRPIIADTKDINVPKAKDPEPDADYKDYNSAEKDIAPPYQAGASTHWLTYSHGRGGSLWGRVYIWDGWGWYHIGGDFWQINRVGTVFALPCGEEFEVERKFTYYANDERGRMVVRKGLVVSVPVQISYPNVNKPPQESVCQRAVQNMAESGMQVAASEGKPCRIIPVKLAAMRRFGAASAKVYYHDSMNGMIHIILKDCRKERENEAYCPAMSENAVAMVRRGTKRTPPVTTEHQRNEGYSQSDVENMMRSPSRSPVSRPLGGRRIVH